MMQYIQEQEFLKALFNAIPALALIVNSEGRVCAINNAASAFFGITTKGAFLKKGGEIFNCIHLGNDPQGCGSGPQCDKCVVRNTAMEAIYGKSIQREKGKLNIFLNNELKTINLLISSAPMTYADEKLAVVIIEDVSKIVELQGFLPICASCKKVIDENGNSDVSLEKYIEEHSEVELTHGYCQECADNIASRYRGAK